MTDKHQNHRALKIMHLSFCIGLLSMMFIFIFINSNDVGTLTLDLDIFTLFPIMIAGLSLFLMQRVSKKKSEGIGLDVYDQDNIEGYRQLKIFQWALINGPALISAMFYFMFGNPLHLIVAGILLVILWFYKPQEVEI